MVFRNPTCSLPAVGGGGGRGGGSVCTVTWHWKETRAGQHLLLTQHPSPSGSVWSLLTTPDRPHGLLAQPDQEPGP